MKKQKLLDLFPLKGTVTKDIIENSDVYKSSNCIGVWTLKAALSNNLQPFEDVEFLWGSYSGGVFKKESSNNGKTIFISSYAESGESLDMMKIERPTTVIFKLNPKIYYD